MALFEGIGPGQHRSLTWMDFVKALVTSEDKLRRVDALVVDEVGSRLATTPPLHLCTPGLGVNEAGSRPGL